MKHTHRTNRPTSRIVIALVGVLFGLIAGTTLLPGTTATDTEPAAAPAVFSNSRPVAAPSPAPAQTPEPEAPETEGPEAEVTEPEAPVSEPTEVATEATPEISLPEERVLGTDADGNKFSAADPALVRDGDRWLVFTTQIGFSNVPMWESTDLTTWSYIADALPALPEWARWGWNMTWAPDAIELDGQWVLFFSAMHDEGDLMCIGHAVADAITGPYTAFDDPIVCELAEGGSIDPMVFIDDQSAAWLLWKVDANAIGERSELRSQRLTDDGTALVGDYSTLLTIELDWEDPLIEQPEMVEIDGVVHLFYAANWYNSADYQVGHAICESVTGPCVRTVEDAGWMITRDRVKGPGAVSVEIVDEQMVGVYHGWIDEVDPENEVRSLIVEPIAIDDDRPAHTGSVAA